MVKQYFKNTYQNWAHWIFEINVSDVKLSAKKLKTDKNKKEETGREENSRILAVGMPWTRVQALRARLQLGARCDIDYWEY